MVDELGLPLLHCSRGTNVTECVNKQLVSLFGTWHTVVKMTDCVMSEFRHRYNQHIFERRRMVYPKVGHTDTWLEDNLQLLVLDNHGVLRHVNCSNTNDFIPTVDQFGDQIKTKDHTDE